MRTPFLPFAREKAINERFNDKSVCFVSDENEPAIRKYLKATGGL